MVRDRPTADASGGEMAQISIDDLDEVELMLIELEISKGKGNLVICVVASPAYRAKVIQLIQDRFSTKITQIENGDTLIYDLKGKKPEGFDVSLWIFPESLPNDIIEALNNFREFFYQAGIPSIVFLTPSALHQVISSAPDFWRYRGGFHVLKGDETGKACQAVEALSMPFNMTYKSKEELLRRKRINEYLLEKIKDKKDIGKVLTELGIIHYLLAEIPMAVECYKRALTIAQEIGDRWNEGACLGNLGLAYSDLGELRKAVEYYEQALKISREIRDRRNEGPWSGNLGNAYWHLGEPLKAIDHYEKALKISQEIGDLIGEGNNLGNLGNAYSYLGEARKAIEYFERGLKIARKIGDRRGEALHLGNLGAACSDMGEMSKAIEYYDQSLTISREIGDRRAETSNLSNLGEAFYELGRRQEAIKCMESAIEIFEQIESPKLIPAKKTLAEWQASDTPK